MLCWFFSLTCTCLSVTYEIPAARLPCSPSSEDTALDLVSFQNQIFNYRCLRICTVVSKSCQEEMDSQTGHMFSTRTCPPKHLFTAPCKKKTPFLCPGPDRDPSNSSMGLAGTLEASWDQTQGLWKRNRGTQSAVI